MNSTTSTNLTRGQLERSLSQQLQKIHRQHLGHAVGKISCQLLNDKLMVVIEDSLTQPEQLLLQKKGDLELVEQVRSDLDDVLRPSIISSVEEISARKVSDFISNTTLETGRTGVIIIFAAES